MGFKVNLRDFDAALRILEKGNAQAVEDGAEAGADSTRARVPSPSRPGPYATGATEASVFVATADGSDFDERKSDAQKLNPHAQFIEEPTVEAFPEMAGEGAANAIFGPATAYADIIEFHQPFMDAASDDAQKALEKGIVKALKKAGFR